MMATKLKNDSQIKAKHFNSEAISDIYIFIKRITVWPLYAGNGNGEKVRQIMKFNESHFILSSFREKKRKFCGLLIQSMGLLPWCEFDLCLIFCVFERNVEFVDHSEHIVVNHLQFDLGMEWHWSHSSNRLWSAIINIHWVGLEWIYNPNLDQPINCNVFTHKYFSEIASDRHAMHTMMMIIGPGFVI